MTVSAPITPAAPGLLSMTTFWPSRAPIPFARRRAVVSACPPGGNGTTSMIGLVGYSCCAIVLSAQATTASPTARARRMLIISRRPSCGLRSLRGRAGFLDQELKLVALADVEVARLVLDHALQDRRAGVFVELDDRRIPGDVLQHACELVDDRLRGSGRRCEARPRAHQHVGVAEL